MVNILLWDCQLLRLALGTLSLSLLYALCYYTSGTCWNSDRDDKKTKRLLLGGGVKVGEQHCDTKYKQTKEENKRKREQKEFAVPISRGEC